MEKDLYTFFLYIRFEAEDSIRCKNIVMIRLSGLEDVVQVSDVANGESKDLDL